MSNRRYPNVPILGQTQHENRDEPNAPGLTAKCEVYDSEIIEIEHVLTILNERASRGSLDLDAFDREIKERFHSLGFIVDVAWWHTNVEEVKRPDIVIKDRTERKEFDYDRQVHEVTNDVLDLGQGGVIKSDDAMREMGEHKH